VTPHPEHTARRGRTRTVAAPRPRRTRVVAHPHGDNRSPHFGQERSPRVMRRSTEAASTSTVSTAPPSATRPSRHSAKSIPGGPPRVRTSARCRRPQSHATHPRSSPTHRHPQCPPAPSSSASSVTLNTVVDGV
jgi:hypothetical protein